MIGTLLIANRGEIVARVARTARRMGIRTAAVHSDPDAASPALAAVDVAVRLPGSAAAETYLDQEAVLGAADAVGADAVHPGFGFLAENARFAAAVVASGRVWIGPSPEHIALMGDKIAARKAAEAAGLPVLPAAAVDEAAAVGFPLVVKAVAGGGGKGMRIVARRQDLDAAVVAASGEAERSFGDGSVYVERLVSPARHVEVQILGDGAGGVIHLFERECSIQRRHQKVIEEAPAPGIDAAQRDDMCVAAVNLAADIGYLGAGTVEFVVGGGSHWFIEMNTRLQVEHPVTEAITGLDLVEWQLRLATGEATLPDQAGVTCAGHAIEARLYAEDPASGWVPAVGRMTGYRRGPGHARYEEAIGEGSEITAHYDPMLAKVIGHRPTRAEAAAVLASELSAMRLHGPATNRDFLVAALRSDPFLAGDTFTSFVDDHPHLLRPGTPPGLGDAHLAAAVWDRMRRNRAGDDLWGPAPPGWRNVPSQRQRVTFDTDVEYAVVGDRVELHVQDRTVTATISGGDPYHVEVGGVSRLCAVRRDGDHIWVNSAEGQTGFVERPRFAAPDAVLTAGGPTAPVPGTVVAVFVAPGDEVDDGTDLLVMEAMKMEHRIRATGPALVAEVLVVAGEQVDVGRLLVRLEERTA